MKETRTIQVKVKPNARTSRLEPPGDEGPWLAQLKSPPVDGKANKELIALVAKHFSCPRSAVAITAGHKGRIKRIRIDPAS